MDTLIEVPEDAMVFDIETDSIFQKGGPTKVHCIGLQHYGSGQEWLFANTAGYLPLAQGIELLELAPWTVAHNGIGFDVKKLNALCGAKIDPAKCLDTVLFARSLLPDVQSVFATPLPAKVGPHSLEAWGYRLGYHKGAFAKFDLWDRFSHDMARYCLRDVALTRKLLDYLLCYQAEAYGAREAGI